MSFLHRTARSIRLAAGREEGDDRHDDVPVSGGDPAGARIRRQHRFGLVFDPVGDSDSRDLRLRLDVPGAQLPIAGVLI
jgi:hypothetical protein